MVERNLQTLNRVTDVTPATGAGQLEAAVGEAGQSIVKAQQESLIVKNFSQAYLDLNAAKGDIQTKYADNPFEGIKAYQQLRSDTLDTYGDQISPFFRGAWNQETKSMGMREDMQMEAWAYTQSRQNAQDNINTTMQNHFAQANQDGADYGSGKINDIDALLNYAPKKSDLIKWGNSNIGSARTDNMMGDYDHSYMKSFMAGVAQTNPQKAAALMDSPEFKDKLTTEDRNEFVGLIEKTAKTNDMLNSLKVTQNTQQVTDLINDPKPTFFDKRLKIDQLEQQGAINSVTAANARRVLTDKNSVDAVTDAPVMADLTTKIYDLNSNAGLNSKDYLVGVQNLHNEILAAQADGKLNASDVQKMNNEMKTLTSARISSATKDVGMQMYDATQQFNVLPPEYRGDATRRLFYATNGQMDKLSPEAYQQLTTTSAQKVIDQINQERRVAALQAVQQAKQPQETKQPLTDDQVLEKLGTNRAELEQAAKQHKTTPDEALKWLRKQNGL
jgi:hypothetical protein